MKKQITSINPIAAAKVMALLYFFVSIPLVLLMALMSMFAPGQSHFGGIIMLVVMPVLYAVFGFIFTLIGAWLYNIIAKMVGGIEFTTSEMPA